VPTKWSQRADSNRRPAVYELITLCFLGFAYIHQRPLIRHASGVNQTCMDFRGNSVDNSIFEAKWWSKWWSDFWCVGVGGGEGSLVISGGVIVSCLLWLF